MQYNLFKYIYIFIYLWVLNRYLNTLITLNNFTIILGRTKVQLNLLVFPNTQNQ